MTNAASSSCYSNRDFETRPPLARNVQGGRFFIVPVSCSIGKLGLSRIPTGRQRVSQRVSVIWPQRCEAPLRRRWRGVQAVQCLKTGEVRSTHGRAALSIREGCLPTASHVRSGVKYRCCTCAIPDIDSRPGAPPAPHTTSGSPHPLHFRAAAFLRALYPNALRRHKPFRSAVATRNDHRLLA